MKLFEQLVWEKADRNLLKAVRSHAGEKWSTSIQAVKDFRKRLLQLQNNRCAYCQAIIEVDENGYRELEHILPKSASKACTISNGRSNDVSKRRHTLGYSSFTFEPKNLAVSCKQCNTQKGSYDPLKNRSRSFLRYPTGTHFEWVHPLLHKYSDHIKLNRDFVFAGKTHAGRRVVEECGLLKAEILEKKFYFRAKTRAQQAETLRDAVEYLVASVKAGVFALVQARRALEEVFKLTSIEASELLTRFHSTNSATEMEKAVAACKVIDSRLRRQNRASSTASVALRKSVTGA